MSTAPGGGAWRVGVIGDPVAHSLSPEFQQPAFDALGIAALFERWPTPAAALPDPVPEEEKLRRLAVLQERVSAHAYGISQAMVGSVQRILVERPSR